MSSGILLLPVCAFKVCYRVKCKSKLDIINMSYLRGRDKIMETVVKETPFFINTEFGQKFSIMQILFYLE
jgi:hypothetical protein